MGFESRFRYLPPAITPLRLSDIRAGLAGHRRQEGRDAFRDELVSFLDGTDGATYTSFRRTLAACLRELASNAPPGSTEVLIPAFCSSDFPKAIEGVGLDPVRYDVDPDSLAADVQSVEGAISEETLALISVSVLGFGSRMDALADVCEVQEVFLVEALGYALGTEYRGRRLGTFGDCAVLNFQQGKPIPVGGGMVVNRNPDLAFSDDGREMVAPNLGSVFGYTVFSRPRLFFLFKQMKRALEALEWAPSRVSTHPEDKFDVDFSGTFATLSDFQGTIAHRVFRRRERYRRYRELTAQFYTNELESCRPVTPIQPIEGLTKLQFVRYPILVATTDLRESLQRELERDGVQAKPLYDWPVIDPESFPGAASVQVSILTLPTHPFVTVRDRRRIVETIRRVVEEYDPDPSLGASRIGEKPTEP